MSASEKLKALGDVLHTSSPESDTAAMHRLFDLADALPQILALVEAAERARDKAEGDWTLLARKMLRDELAPALAALEEALS